ncbi:MAG: PKD domain-containing protein, partial [Candidatus Zixiibacteriota bacterium]
VVVSVDVKFALLNTAYVFSQGWIKDTTGIMQLFGANNNAKSFKVINDELWMGGAFIESGGITTNSIAVWNNINWYNLNGGIPTGGILSIQDFNNIIYFGGSFYNADGIALADNIAFWDGSNWNYVGNLGVLNATVSTLAAYNNMLFVGGGFTKFTYTSPNSHYHIAAWNDTTWLNVGGLPGGVQSLAVFNNELYACGSWSTVKKYKGGTIWEDVGGSASFYMSNLFVDTVNNYLYVSGDFDIIDDTIICDGLGYWDGFKWKGIKENNLSSTLTIKEIAIYRGDIYGILPISSFNGFDYNWIVRWTGSKWDTLGSGVNDVPRALQVYNDELYVGGYFTEAGGDTAVGLARWYAPPNTDCDYLQPIAETYADTFSLYSDSVAVEFYNNNPYVQSWKWDYGDGDSADIRLPVHYYTDTGTYNVCVTVNDTGCIKTACKTIYIDDKTGVNEISPETIGFILFPNPTDGSFTVEITPPLSSEAGRGHEIKIFNLKGGLKTSYVLSEIGNRIEVPTQGWRKGTYLVCLLAGNKLLRTEKVVVN